MFLEIATIKKYTTQLKEEYINEKKCLSESRWPNFTPTQFINLGFIILNHKRTEREANHLAKLKRLGSYSATAREACKTPNMDYDSADEYDTDTPIKEDISDIFSHASIEETKILAEGAPGIRRQNDALKRNCTSLGYWGSVDRQRNCLANISTRFEYQYC